MPRILDAWRADLAPVDPATLAGTGALMLVVALAASYLPARRASSLDPLKCLTD